MSPGGVWCGAHIHPGSEPLENVFLLFSPGDVGAFRIRTKFRVDIIKLSTRCYCVFNMGADEQSG